MNVLEDKPGIVCPDCDGKGVKTLPPTLGAGRSVQSVPCGNCNEKGEYLYENMKDGDKGAYISYLKKFRRDLLARFFPSLRQ